MRPYTKSVDIWAMSPAEVARLQPGQWVYAGSPDAKGRFFGVGASIVVAWAGRLPKGKRYREYLKRYAQFGREARKAGAA